MASSPRITRGETHTRTRLARERERVPDTRCRERDALHHMMYAGRNELPLNPFNILDKTHFHGQGLEQGDPEDWHVFGCCFNGTRGPQRGTYVEMGALDGVKFSNTLFFERQLGWSGLLIEPSRLFKSLEKNRGTHNYFANDVVCEDNATVGWYEETLSNTWSAVSGIDSLAKVRAPVKQSRPKLSQRVCKPLQRLLAAADIRHIDFFSLDVQGAELSVLKTMDWSIPVEILLVELDGSDRQKDMEVRQMLRAHGLHFYQRMGFQTVNEIWTRFPHTCGEHHRNKSLATPRMAAPDCARQQDRAREDTGGVQREATGV